MEWEFPEGIRQVSYGLGIPRGILDLMVLCLVCG